MAGQYCNGLQVHVTKPRIYRPVFTTIAVVSGYVNFVRGFPFQTPPYEYETEKMPFDILSGSLDLADA